jgi:hypothetical protein
MAGWTTEDHQYYEQGWWGNCVNTFSEETKQITYAWNMGLSNVPDSYTGRWPQYDLAGKSVLDIGGGPSSILLKTVNGQGLVVADPCPYPAWVEARYAAMGISQFREPGETFNAGRLFSEVWIYNVLQHVEDPQKIIANAHRHAPILRMFEWVNCEPTLGHPWKLTKEDLDDWIGNGADGTVAFVNENTAVGEAYFGVFPL